MASPEGLPWRSQAPLGLMLHRVLNMRHELSAPRLWAALHWSSHLLSPDAMAATQHASLSRGGIRGVRHGENVLELERECFQPYLKGQEFGSFAGLGLSPGGGSLPETAGRVCSSAGTRVAFSGRGGPGTLCSPTARPSESGSLQMILFFFPCHSARGWRQKFLPSFP